MDRVASEQCQLRLSVLLLVSPVLLMVCGAGVRVCHCRVSGVTVSDRIFATVNVTHSWPSLLPCCCTLLTTALLLLLYPPH